MVKLGTLVLPLHLLRHAHAEEPTFGENMYMCVCVYIYIYICVCVCVCVCIRSSPLSFEPRQFFIVSLYEFRP